MKSQRACTAASLLLGALLFALMLAGSAFAQSDSSPAAASGPASPWDQRVNADAMQADAWFQNCRFRNGATLDRLKIHYATLGTPNRNAKGDIDNAVLVLHWTGGDSRALLSPIFTQALFNPGRPLDAKRYFLIFPDSVGHGQSSKPSDGLKTKFPDYDYGDIVALNFSDDEFNPDDLQVIQNSVPKLKQGRYVVQPGTAMSPGHFTMTRPDLWAQHVGNFMQWLGDMPSQTKN